MQLSRAASPAVQVPQLRRQEGLSDAIAPAYAADKLDLLTVNANLMAVETRRFPGFEGTNYRWEPGNTALQRDR